MRIQNHLALAGLLSLGACATAYDTSTYTPVISASGRPEAYYGSDPQAVSSRLASGCMDNKGTVTEATPNQVVCNLPMSLGQEVVASLMVGNRYSTQTQRYVRFNIIPVSYGSRVQAQSWVESTTAFGQKNTQDMSTGKTGAQIQAFLYRMGGADAPRLAPPP